MIDKASLRNSNAIKQVWILRDSAHIELENLRIQQQRMNQSFDKMLKEMDTSISIVEETLKNGNAELLQLYRHESKHEPNQEKRNELHTHKSI